MSVFQRSVALEGGGRLLYAESWLSPMEANAMLAALVEETPWASRKIRIAGREIAEPRLTAWYGDPEARYTYSGIRLEPLPWPPRIADLRTRVEAASSARFNSV